MEIAITYDDKKRLLRFVPGRILSEVAKENDLSSRGKKEDQIGRLAESLPQETILELHSEFAYAGNPTCYLFKTSALKAFSMQDLSERLVKKDLLNTLERILPPEDIEYGVQPTLVLSIGGNSRVLFLFEFLGKDIPILRPNTRTREWITPLEQVACSYHPDIGLLDVRSRNATVASEVGRELCKLLDLETPERIRFSDQQIKIMIERAATLRNARLKPIFGVLSSLSLTARQGEDLRGEGIFEEWKDKAKLTGFYLWLEPTGKRKIGIQINIRETKIYFKSYVGETEIDGIFETIQPLLGLSS